MFDELQYWNEKKKKFSFILFNYVDKQIVEDALSHREIGYIKIFFLFRVSQRIVELFFFPKLVNY